MAHEKEQIVLAWNSLNAPDENGKHHPITADRLESELIRNGNNVEVSFLEEDDDFLVLFKETSNEYLVDITGRFISKDISNSSTSSSEKIDGNQNSVENIVNDSGENNGTNNTENTLSSDVVKHTITLDPNGGTIEEKTIEAVEGKAIGTLPTPSLSYLDFKCWVTDEGEIINSNTIMGDSDVVYYAQWKVDISDASIINSAINTFPSGDIPSDLIIRADLKVNISIPAGKNIILDLQNHKLSNDKTNKNTIINNGKLEIINGTIECNATNSSAIDNNGTGTLTLNNITISAINKQGLVNKGGTINIINSTINAKNAYSIDNRTNGIINITSGTITDELYNPISNAGTINLGEKDGIVSTTTPIIKGPEKNDINMRDKDNKTHAIKGGTVNFYDGILKSVNTPIFSSKTNVEDDYKIITSTETINNIEFNTNYLGK